MTSCHQLRLVGALILSDHINLLTGYVSEAFAARLGSLNPLRQGRTGREYHAETFGHNNTQ